jgi:O-succinylbenzoic acid--CoA ligase
VNLTFHTDNQELQASVRAFVSEWTNEVSFFEVKTSGSTGNPKTIQIQKDHARASAQMTGQFLNINKSLSALLCLSPDTIAGKMMLVRAMEFDWNLHIVAPTSNPFKELDTPIHFAAMVPLQVEKVLNENSERFTENMKVIIGGGPISKGLEDRILTTSAMMYHTFGMTETISHIALRHIQPDSTAFSVLPGIRIREVDGRLEISAPKLGVSELITNDCIELNGPESFIWKGRADFTINSGGIKIHPEEIERKLASAIPHPFFITGMPDTTLGQKVVLCIESEYYPISKPNLKQYLSKYHIPKSLYFFKSFCYTKSDKINRLKTLETKNYDEVPLL